MLINSLFVRPLRVVMAGVVTFVWCLAPAVSAVAATTDEERAATFSAQLQASLLALEDGDRDAPRDHWDPQYVVDTVGIETADLYKWVHDSVVWMPYPGTLRGPEGVLMDRVGNSLDQSLLLATLLKLAGHEARLAHAKLSEAVVDALWEQLRAARQTVRPAASATDLQTVAASETSDPEELVTADLYGIDRASVADTLNSANSEASTLATDMAARINVGTATLSSIVGPLDGAAAAKAVLADARASLADHWWVQVQKNGGWTDLDLMAAPETGGKALAAATETVDPAAIPEDSQQKVIIRVIAEELKDGALSQHVVLEQAVKPHDLIGTTLGFRHFPMAWPEQWPQVTPDDIQIKLRSALYAQTEWLPVLVAGDAVLGSVGVYDTGELDPSPRPVNPFMQMTVGMMGMVSKATDALATGGDPNQLLPNDPSLDEPRPPRPEGELVAERLEYEIQRPGVAPRKITRELFDLIGAAARAKGDLSAFTMSGQKALDRSMAMLAESEIQILPSRLAPEFLTHLGAENALGNRPVLDELARDPFGKLPSNFMELFSKLNGMPAALYTLASLRFGINPFSDWVYVDRPSIVAQHTRLMRAGGGDFRAQVSLDIVENGVGVDPLAADNALTLRMSQGIADTNAEAVALTKVGAVSPNTADAFALGGDAWHALQPGEQQVLGPLGYQPDVVARISHDMDGGSLIVIPPRAVEGGAAAGWWQVDPATGTTLGIGPSGHGQAMVEYALIIIIEAMMAGAQCALEASLNKALEKTLAEKAKGSDSGVATGAGARAGYEQAKKDLSQPNFRNRCIAAGMFAGFRSLLIGFALNAARTSGDKGYDGSKPTNSFERNANNNARNTSQPSPQPRAPNMPSSTPTTPGIGPQGRPTTPGIGPRGTPTTPGVAPEANGPRGNPTIPGVAPEANGPRGKPTSPGVAPEANGPRPSPLEEATADTARAPNANPSPADQFKAAQQRATDAQNELVNHNPVDTPEGRAETQKLWNNLDEANRDRIRAYDSMPRNMRPSAIPAVPPPAGPSVDPLGNTQAVPATPVGGPASGSDGFGGYKTGEGPPSQVPNTQVSPGGDFGGYKTGEGPPSQVPQTQPAASSEFGGYKTGQGPPSQVPQTEAVPGQGTGTKTGEAPPSSIPEVSSPKVGPEPSVDDLLGGLNKPAGISDQRPAPKSSTDPGVDELLGGLNKGGTLPPMAPSANPAVDPFAITQPGLPLPARPKPPNGNPGVAETAATGGAEAVKTTGLAGLAGALEMVSTP